MKEISHLPLTKLVIGRDVDKVGYLYEARDDIWEVFGTLTKLTELHVNGCPPLSDTALCYLRNLVKLRSLTVIGKSLLTHITGNKK